MVNAVNSRTQSLTVPKALKKDVRIQKMASKTFEGWRIFYQESSCGHVKFYPKEDAYFKKHASVDFKVTQPRRGRHIGRFALQKAICASKYEKFAAHLRKTNIASQKALQAVGFKKVDYPGNQLCLFYKKIEKK